ncbi:MAG: AsnC family transcriptional regulator, partial [Flavobacterium sp.]
GTIRTDTPDWQPWIVYFLKALQKQKKQLEKKIERERIVADTLPELSVQILEFAKSQDKITIGQIVKLPQANRNTIKKHLQSLVLANHLVQSGTGKGTWYRRT